MVLFPRWILILPVVALPACSPRPDLPPAAAPATSDVTSKPSIEELRRRAEAGDHAAEWQLGSRYETGSGVPKDLPQSMMWYRRAAADGYAEAQNSLGSIAQAEHDYPTALAWYRKAADQGHATALNNLGYLYDLGLGVAQDRQHAFELYGQSADGGEPRAMLNIAVMYGAGQLGPKDLMKAYEWMLRARRFRGGCGRDAALDRRVDDGIHYVEQHLLAEQVERARDIAASWSPKRSCDMTTL